MKSKAFDYLARPELSPREESALEQELSRAYHMDEAAMTSRQVQRVAERVKARLDRETGQEARSEHPAP